MGDGGLLSLSSAVKFSKSDSKNFKLNWIAPHHGFLSYRVCDIWSDVGSLLL